MKKIIIFLTAFTVLVMSYSSSFATLGVGVATGKIIVEDELKPGIIYELPSITVLNTGDEKSEYKLSIAYHEAQEELKPDIDWFKFTPSIFELEPNTTQEVKVVLDLPIKALPGDYFAYVEASPIKSASSSNGATVGIAAATKLYFNIVPANLVLGIYHKAISTWKYYSPWSERIALIIGAGIIVYIGSKNLNINIQLKKKDEKKNEK